MIADLLIIDRDLFFAIAIGNCHLVKRSQDDRDGKNAIYLAIFELTIFDKDRDRDHDCDLNFADRANALIVIDLFVRHQRFYFRRVDKAR